MNNPNEFDAYRPGRRQIYLSISSEDRVHFFIDVVAMETIKYERCAINEVSGTLVHRCSVIALSGECLFVTSRREKMEA